MRKIMITIALVLAFMASCILFNINYEYEGKIFSLRIRTQKKR
ncbi:conserved protein of unknown function [Tepidanaerobacter acetatoxydans Re1]|uniref:Lipoprotein n=1 Tax=Tepidanaerobacter acetatoxydans (strain DSM 21804 / JCM 16047 / Re1) TaxID=1209989 RepID=F4LX49_TEPAE|nr:hypothetical protein TepRe1_1714 [Tepidanaerobacter acetatoxydans Re1]CCP26650.1 conserved protein of unknown function [Tepidanaerobacter acetatoxydans Re1]